MNKEKGAWKARWTLERWSSEADRKKKRVYTNEECKKLFGIDEQISVVNQTFSPHAGNMLVNSGINELFTILCSSASGTKFDNTNAYIGVGDSSTAEAATQTDLQAATNKVRVAMNASYPTYGTSQKATFQSDFGSSDANFDWNEFGVFNASSAGTMLNRKVSAQGTKVSGQTWRFTVEISLS